MKFARVGVAVAAAAIVVTACGGSAAPARRSRSASPCRCPAPRPRPQPPPRRAPQLAIKDFKLEGYTFTVTVLDHAVNGVHDPQQGAKDMTTLVSDAAVVGVVGPFNSSVAKVQIPISNEAGLLQCSPANTNPDLTKGDAGKELRAKNPDKINYVRVATTDDIQGPAVAQYGYTTLGLKSVAIIDDTETYGKGIADAFSAEWEKLGGTVVGREGAPKGTTDYTAILTKFKDANPDAVFYGGVTPRVAASSASRCRRSASATSRTSAATASRTAPAPPTARSSTSPARLLRTASAPSPRSPSIPARPTSQRSTRPSTTRSPARTPRPATRAPRSSSRRSTTAASKGDVTREAVRAAGTDTATTFETVLGPVKFDAVGDTNQKIISLYKVDLTAADGKGDWIFDSQVNYGE